MKKLILIDGTGLVYRSFFAVPPNMRSASGEMTNAVLGFTNILLGIILKQKPDYMAVAFDKKGPTFRHKEYKEYKATRVSAPQGLYDQIPRVQEIVEAFGIPLFETDGFEADDILATIAKQTEKEKNLETYIATGDFDMFQTVSANIKIIYPSNGFNDPQIFSNDEILQKYGLSPSQIPDYKGLCGDSSDNIKGVKGIGEKTAKTLLKQYKTLDSIYAHLEEITPIGVRKKLDDGREDAYFSKKLATLVSNVPVHFILNECLLKSPNGEKIIPLFEELGFFKLLSRLGFGSSKRRVTPSKDQISLF